MKIKMMILLLACMCLIKGQETQNEINYGYKLLPLSESSRPKDFIRYYRSKPGPSKSENLPPVVDCSGLMPPVLDQGGQGSCVAFSHTYGLAYLNNSRYGYSTDHQYSQSLLYNLAVGNQPTGMNIEQANHIMSEVGYVRSALFPYTDNNWSTMPDWSILRTAIKTRTNNDWSWFYAGDTISRYEPKEGYLGINIARKLLAEGKAVILQLQITGGYGDQMQPEKWIYSDAAFGHLTPYALHSVCVAGYNDTMTTRDGKGAFKIINSWGANKFDHGYCWITYKILSKMGNWGYFSTFSLKDDNYTPQLLVETELENFGYLINFSVGLEDQNSIASKQIWDYRRGNLNQSRFKRSIIDLTDLLTGDGIVNGILLRGDWLDSDKWNAKPVIKSLHVYGKGIDTVINSNIIIDPAVVFTYNNYCYWGPYGEWGIKYPLEQKQLPVELVSFNAQLKKSSVIINWQTATELNNKGFQVYRNKELLGFIQGAGTAAEKNSYCYVDRNVPEGKYTYELVQMDYNGTSRRIASEVIDLNSVPAEYCLFQNYPNPFNPVTTIRYSIPEGHFVSLKIFDMLGQEITSLVDGYRESGSYEESYDASELNSGVYVYQIRAGKFIEAKKLTVMK